MAFQDITFQGRVLRPRHAAVQPEFASETVLVSDPWDYVDLWLKRNHKEDARAFWEQAREFANAADMLPVTSAPLPAYYCFLNAVKALLNVRGVHASSQHGVTGASTAGKHSLDAEKVNFLSSGVLAGLCTVLGESTAAATYSLKDALYNLPYIHRAYCLTFTSRPELFFPIKNARFVRKSRSHEAWFCAELEARYDTMHTLGKLPATWEADSGAPIAGTIRLKKRLRWDGRRPNSSANQERLRQYHQRLRVDVCYIFGPSRLWYVKRAKIGASWLSRSPLTLTFAIMHRLSELSRYDPLALRHHSERHHNWLLSEFVRVAPRQFIDEVASEITGSDFMLPGIRK
jgi:hypothetical protein